ncbi:serine protease 7-like [Anoplophora glabripennis]|uniref:serine protease 7-like n=1 Tax=Anoplophora glabripennis TaxID=217634 RepID=UPI000875152E|nr:serine protease 7-like [Anoplophora glabripennis]
MYNAYEIIFLILWLTLQTAYAQLDSSCKTPNGELGTCKSILGCHVLLDAVIKRKPKQMEFVKKSVCGPKPLVCCGSQGNWKPDRSDCGYQLSDKIYGGGETELYEFPWMALLEYKNPSNRRRFSCGGVIISKRYVLTAAHCVGQFSQRVGELVNVRLGEWDLRQEVDCIRVGGSKYCNKPPQDFGVSDILIHPDHQKRFSKGAGDIALIRLNRNITYSEFIKPICLPFPAESSAVGDTTVVAGWGQTENATHSPVKLKVEIPVVDRSLCVSSFPSLDIRTQICAGGKKGKDSCFGDSGGPLMKMSKHTLQWYVDGIISFGQRCGEEGSPGVYTNVSEYLDWIMEHIRD